MAYEATKLTLKIKVQLPKPIASYWCMKYWVTWYEVYLSVFTDNFVKEGILWNWLEKGLMAELFRLLKFSSCSVPLIWKRNLLFLTSFEFVFNLFIANERQYTRIYF